MRTAYRSLAYLICALVALQAAAHAWASAGLVKFIAGGGTLDMSPSAPPPDVPEFAGIIIHALNGMYVIPLVALVLVGVAFAARIPHGIKRAVIVLAAVVVQVVLGFLGHGVTALSFLHGVNALLLFAAALLAAQVASRPATPAEARVADHVGSAR